MLPKQNRLPLKREFTRLKKEGKLFHGQLFSIIVRRRQLTISNQQLAINIPRFAFIVSKKIDKKATKRNRVKRLLQEVIYRLLPRLKSNLDIVILAQKTILNATFTKISFELEVLFEKAKLLSNNEENRPVSD